MQEGQNKQKHNSCKSNSHTSRATPLLKEAQRKVHSLECSTLANIPSIRSSFTEALENSDHILLLVAKEVLVDHVVKSVADEPNKNRDYHKKR